MMQASEATIKSRDEIERMNITDVSIYLKNNNIPDQYCEAFEENLISGKKIVDLTESDVKSMVRPLGIVKDISKLIPPIQVDEAPRTTSLQTHPTRSPPYEIRLPSSSPPPVLSSPGSPPPPPPSPSGSVSGCSSMSTASKSQRFNGIQIPDRWRPDTQSCIDQKCLTREARADIVRTLITLLTSKVGPRPTREQCSFVARQLVLMHPFVRDDLGTGYASWSDKLLERARNVLKSASKRSRSENSASSDKATPSKKSKNSGTLVARYPVQMTQEDSVDPETTEQHIKALDTELEKPKPREQVLLPLMKSTYSLRREFVLNEAGSVQDILHKFSALKRPAVIEQEMSLIIGKSDVRSSFIKEWKMYAPGVIAVGKNSRRKAVVEYKSKLDRDDADEQLNQVVALQILCELLNPPAKTKNPSNAGDYVYKEYDMSCSVVQASKEITDRNSPWIAGFTSSSGDQRQYFIVIEQQVLCQAPNIQAAIFLLFAAYYVFNLKYPKQATNTFLFLQDYVLQVPDSLKRLATYLATASDIKRSITVTV